MKVAMDISIMVQRRTGTEEYIEGLVWGLSRLGVTVIGIGRRGQALVPNLAGLGLDARSGRSIWEKWWWERFGVTRALDGGIGLLHIPYLTHPPRSTRVPSVVTVHDLIPFQMEAYRSRWRDRVYFDQVKHNLSHATRLVAISQATYDDIAHIMPALAQKASVIPNGVHPSYFEPADAEATERVVRRLALERSPRILYVGGYDTRKNVETLVRAAKALFDRHDGELVLVGAKSHPGASGLKTLTAEWGLGHRVIFTPYLNRDDLIALYHACDVFAFPSRYEGFGLPPAQALAVGIPVVAGDNPAVREVLGDSGRLVPPDAVDAWVDALDQILKNPALAAKMVKSGHLRAQMFSWERVAAQYRDLYQELAGE